MAREVHKKLSVAVTVDEYRELLAAARPGESESDTIRRCIRESIRPRTHRVELRSPYGGGWSSVGTWDVLEAHSRARTYAARGAEVRIVQVEAHLPDLPAPVVSLEDQLAAHARKESASHLQAALELAGGT